MAVDEWRVRVAVMNAFLAMSLPSRSAPQNLARRNMHRDPIGAAGDLEILGYSLEKKVT
jgi:hypothetical protein